MQNVNIPSDIYRVKKDHLQQILTKFNIRFRDEDLVADLRPVVADLKAFITHNWTEQKKAVLKKLISKHSLTENELEAFPSLKRIEQFVRERENLYDLPPSEIDSDNYEDIEINFRLRGYHITFT